MSQRDDGTRQRILDAAGAVFAAQGFEKATIREIISRAEVNLSAVNYHFGDKEKLYRATLKHAHEMAVEQVPLPVWSDETPPEVQLHGMIRTMLQRMLAVQRLPWQARLMMREFMQPTGAAQEVVENYVRPHHEKLLSVLELFLPENTSRERKQKLAFSVVGQCLFYKLSGPLVGLLVSEDDFKEHFDADHLADHITHVMLAALGHPSVFVTQSTGQSTGPSAGPSVSTSSHTGNGIHL